MKVTQYNLNTIEEAFRPRLIVWEIVPSKEIPSENMMLTSGNGRQENEPLSTHECLLIIDSIARTAKPIVVLTGTNLFERNDLFVIVEYGVALGLKMIVEVRPAELSDNILQTFSVFGPKVFRLLLDDCIAEDQNTRFKKTSNFTALESAVARLRKAGYEIHFGMTISQPAIRDLAFKHDYAFRNSATGLYCHLCFDEAEEFPDSPETGEDGIESVIDAIARMKGISPKNMYFSPQCIKYEPRNSQEPHADDFKSDADGERAASYWAHCCFGGKTYAFIGPTGKVQICAALTQECGNLRQNGYDFESIWTESDVFQQLRQQTQTCKETREVLKPAD